MNEEQFHFAIVLFDVMVAFELVLFEQLKQIARENVLEDEYLGDRKLMKHDVLPTRFRGTNAGTQNRTERIGLDLIDLVQQRWDFPTEKIQRKRRVHHLNRELDVLLFFHTQADKSTAAAMDSFKRVNSLFRFNRITWVENSSPEGMTSCREQ